MVGSWSVKGLMFTLNPFKPIYNQCLRVSVQGVHGNFNLLNEIINL